jgi:type IV secretory pathway VirB10-like protein
VAVVIGLAFWRGEPPPPGSSSAPPDPVIEAATSKWGWGSTPAPPPAADPPAIVLPPAPAPVLPTAEQRKARRIITYATENTGQASGQGGGTGGFNSNSAATADPASSPAGTANKPTTTGIEFATAQLPGRRASPAQDMSRMLVPGLYSMILDTPINTERGGSFLAHLPREIRSPLGVVLMEKNTVIRGTVNTQMSAGQGRVALINAWAQTPNGVFVPLGDASVGDATGRNGVPGVVNSNLWPRLQGAVILMATQGAFQLATTALQTALSSGQGNTFFNLNSGGIESAVAEAVRSGMSIQNSADIAVGKELTFYITEPISFEDSYSLENISDPQAGEPPRAARRRKGG